MHELSDGCLIQALVLALDESRCSYFADTKFPLPTEGSPRTPQDGQKLLFLPPLILT